MPIRFTKLGGSSSKKRKKIRFSRMNLPKGKAEKTPSEFRVAQKPISYRNLTKKQKVIEPFRGLVPPKKRPKTIYSKLARTDPRDFITQTRRREAMKPPELEETIQEGKHLSSKEILDMGQGMLRPDVAYSLKQRSGTLAERQAQRQRDIIKSEVAKPEFMDKGFIKEMQDANKQGLTQIASAFGTQIETFGRKHNFRNVEKIGENVSDHFQKVIVKNPQWGESTTLKGWKDPRMYARLVGAGLPSIAGAMATGVATAAATGGNPIAGLAGGFAFTKTLEGSNAYQEAIQAGATEEQATKAQGFVGNVNGILEMMPIGRFLNNVPGWKRVRKNIVRRVMGEFIKQGAYEGSTELTQQIVSNAVQKEFDQNRELFEGVLESFVGGALLGGGMGAGGVGVPAISRKITEPKPIKEKAEIPPVKPKPIETPTKEVKPSQKPISDEIKPVEKVIAEPKVEPLVQEAKKYKTADEFVKSRTLFHGTDLKILENIKKEGFKAGDEGFVSLTSDPNVARQFAEGSARASNSKPVVINVDSKSTKITRNFDPEDLESIRTSEKEFIVSPEDAKNLKILDESQLTDIWEKAQEKKVEIDEKPKVEKPVEEKPKVSQKEIEKGFSLHYEKIKKKFGFEEEGVEFDKIENKEVIKRAYNYTQRNPQGALQVAYGFKNAPPSTTVQAVRRSLMISLSEAGKTDQAQEIAKLYSKGFSEAAQTLQFAKTDLADTTKRRAESEITTKRLEKIGENIPSKVKEETTQAKGKRKVKAETNKASQEVVNEMSEQNMTELTSLIDNLIC